MVQFEDVTVHNRNIGYPELSYNLFDYHGINSFSFPSNVLLDGIGFDSFLSSGTDDVLGRLLPNCAGVEFDCDVNGWIDLLV